MFEHTTKYKECPMRNIGYNCDPHGGDCANGVSDEICEALHSAYNKGFKDGSYKMKEYLVGRMAFENADNELR